MGIGIAGDFPVAFQKGLPSRCRRPYSIDAGAEVDNLIAIDARGARPGIDVPTVFSVDRRFYEWAIDISTKITSERMAVTRHKDRASFNISILTGVTSSPI